MATVTLVPSAIFPLHTVLIMKPKLEQRIKAEIQAKNFKQWILKRILKTILWRHYYSIKGLEKVILKDFQHNAGNLHPMSHKWSPHSALSIVESMYKLPEDLFLESGLAPSWRNFSGYKMSVLSPSPKMNVHGREHQKIQKLYLKGEKKKRHGRNKSPVFN